MTALVVQGKEGTQNQRRDSRVHFQTPEANVVSEASDPLQDDRNNSSEAGSTPFQKARPARRVSFAAQDCAGMVRNDSAFNTSKSRSSQADIASIRQGSHNVADTDAAVLSANRSAGSRENAAPSSHQAAHDSIAAGKPGHVSSELIAAPGSTPYLKRSNLSAALQAIEADANTTASNADVKTVQSDLSFRMSQLLQPGLQQQDMSDQEVQFLPVRG